MCLGVSFSEMVSCGREDCGWIFVLPRAKVGGQSGIHNSRPNCRALIGHGWTARAGARWEGAGRSHVRRSRTARDSTALTRPPYTPIRRPRATACICIFAHARYVVGTLLGPVYPSLVSGRLS